MIRRAIALSFIFVACGGNYEVALQKPAAHRQGIIGGVEISTLPAVGSLAYASGSSYEVMCTGTIIAARKVVTAAHCIDPHIPKSSLRFVTGRDVTNPDSVYTIAEWEANEAYDGDTNDIGLLTLGESASETPMPLNPRMDSTWVGRPIYWVGYGVTDGDAQTGAGLKRAVNIDIDSVAPLTFSYVDLDHNTCQGDSGGPGFYVDGDQYLLAGITSSGDLGCHRDGLNTRVDAMLPWLAARIGATCGEDGDCKEGCVPVDIDCACAKDGACTLDCPDLRKDPDCPKNCIKNNVCAEEACPAPDVDCVAVGAACRENELICQSRLCINDAQNEGTYCSQTCKASRDCPKGMECSTAGQCITKQLPIAAEGATCEDGTSFCEEGTTCSPAPKGGTGNVCQKPCSENGECAKGQICKLNESDYNRYCAKDEPLPPAPGIGTKSSSTIGAEEPKGGCSSTTPAAAAWPLVLALAALARRRRRSARV